MTARSRMTHRAIRQVNTGTTTDDYGQPVAPTWLTTGDPVACRFSQKSKRQVINDKVAYVEEMRLMVSRRPGWTADSWSESDRVLKVEDRVGTEIASGPFEIEAVEWYPSHFEVLLKRVGGQLAGK